MYELPPPPPSPAPSGPTANCAAGRGCGARPQPIAVEGAEPGSRRAAAGSPRAESAERPRGAAGWGCMEDPAAPGAGSSSANGNGNGGGKGKQAAPKGREAFRSQRRESEVRNPRASVGAGRRLRAGSGGRGDSALSSSPSGAPGALGAAPRSGRLRGPPHPGLGAPQSLVPLPVACAGRGLLSRLALLWARRWSAIASIPDTFRTSISLHLCSPLKWGGFVF